MTFLSDIASLIKIRITLSVGFIAAIGWYVAERGWGDPFDFAMMLGTTLLVCAGVCAFNHVVEWKSDALMRRTRNRPIPGGRVSATGVLIAASFLTAVGLVLMWLYIGLGMALGAGITGIIYILIYTPIKKFSWINTTIGAVPGALPIMGGWYASQGELGWEGWLLFAIMFFWQHPHFYAIAWLCREDYENAGYQMLVKEDPEGRTVFAHAIFHTVLLTLAGAGLLVTDFRAGWIYGILTGILNLGFLLKVVLAYGSPKENKGASAQKVLTYSVWYQILFFIIIIIDNIIRFKIF